MTDQYDYDCAFYRSVPELRKHFAEAVTHIPADKEGAELLKYVLKNFNALSTLPTDRQEMTGEQREKSKDLKMAIETAVNVSSQYPELKAEFDTMFKIINKNIKP